MCGIAGIMTAREKSPDCALLSRIAAALNHRGPDGAGDYLRDNVALAHKRLAIIDLERGGHPLREPGGTALVGNGEIYNYIELREELQAWGMPFATNSDFEPILHLYRAFGLDFTNQLRGMYALAIHDPRSRRLILARDPYGIKPLYYVEAPGFFAFASETHALAQVGLSPVPAGSDVYVELLQLQYLTGTRSTNPKVKRVLPGEIIIVEDGVVIERRRNVTLPPGPPQAWSDDEALERLDSVLLESVKLHQRSDVPYGLFLSGGIDSSALLAAMSRLNGRILRTFTIGFPDRAAVDERILAKKLAREVGAEHTEVEFEETDFWDVLPQVAGALDDPTADYAALPTYKLAATAANSVKVVLTGEGGDEFFAGYGWYRRALRPYVWPFNGLVRHREGKFDRLGVITAATARWRDAIAASEGCEAQQDRSRLQAAQAVDVANWLPNDLLTKLDRCLMAHSLEGRVPFVDPILGVFGFQLPDRLKIRNRLGKYLLRLWLQRHLPSAEPFSRKRGFTVPVNRWIARQSESIGPLVARQEGVRQLCDSTALLHLFASTEEQTRMARWSLLFFACWHQHHILGIRGARNAFEHLAAT